MKYIFVLLCLLFCLPAYSADNPTAEGGILPQEETTLEQPAPIEQTETVQSIAAAEKTVPAKEQSLEDFLKQQEELWLKEKQESKTVEAPSVNAVLPPPSVLTEANLPPAQETAKAPQAKSSAPVRKTATLKKSADTAVKQNAATEQAQTVLADEAKQEERAKQEEEKGYKENWPAFFRGFAFALLLGVAVWLLSKYQ